MAASGAREGLWTLVRETWGPLDGRCVVVVTKAEDSAFVQQGSDVHKNQNLICYAEINPGINMQLPGCAAPLYVCFNNKDRGPQANIHGVRDKKDRQDYGTKTASNVAFVLISV